MNWRRGLLFALIHLCIAVPLIVRQDAQSWPYLHHERQVPAAPPAASPGEAVGWDMDGMWVYVEPQERIVTLVNFPAYAVSGWHHHPRSRFTIAGRSEAEFGRFTRKATVLTAFAFALLIFVQWLLVGGYPVVKPKRRWLEPGVFITICALFSVCLLALPSDLHIADTPMLGVLTGWFVWFGILAVTLTKKAWRELAPRPAA